MVNIGLRVLTRPDAEKLPLITQTIGVDFDDKVKNFKFFTSIFEF